MVEVGQKIQTSSYKISSRDIKCSIVTSVKNSLGGGRGIGMGNTCKSMADSCQCMTKPTTIL